MPSVDNSPSKLSKRMLLLALQAEEQLCWVFYAFSAESFQRQLEIAKIQPSASRTVIFAVADENESIRQDFAREMRQLQVRWELKQDRRFTGPLIALLLTNHLCQYDALLMPDVADAAVLLQHQSDGSDITVFSDLFVGPARHTKYPFEDLLKGRIAPYDSFCGESAVYYFSNHVKKAVFRDENFLRVANNFADAPGCFCLAFWAFATANAENATIAPRRAAMPLYSGPVCERQSQLAAELTSVLDFADYQNYIAQYVKLGGALGYES